MSDNCEFDRPEWPETYWQWPEEDGTYQMMTHTFWGAYTRTKNGDLYFMKNWTGVATFKLTDGQYNEAKAAMQTRVDTMTNELKALLLRVVPTDDPAWAFDRQIHHHMLTATSVAQSTENEVWDLYFNQLVKLQSSLSNFTPSSSKYE